MSVSVTRKATPLSAWHLTDATAMTGALTDLSALGYQGTVGLAPDASAWRIDLTFTDSTTVSAQTGDWLVLDGALQAFNETDFAANYTS